MTARPALAPAVTTATLVTADGVRLSARYDPPARPATDVPTTAVPTTAVPTTAVPTAEVPTAGGPAVVVAHGLTGSWRRPAVRRAATAFTRTAGVISFDFRGHGRSGGRCTVGDREVLDLAAAVDWAHRLGHQPVSTVGFSMGAAVALRHAAAFGGLAAVVAVSGPSRWYYRDTAEMRRVHWMIEKRLGRLAGRVLRRTRIATGGWDPVPEPPDAAAARIAPTPLLVVHGDADALFPVTHAQALYDAANEPRELWIEAGYGHAENAAGAELLDRIAGWVAARSAAWPPRDPTDRTSGSPLTDGLGEATDRTAPELPVRP